MNVSPLSRTLLFFVVFVGLFVLIPGKAKATHLIGGTMGYEHLGPDPLIPGQTRYRINFQAYMDCNSPNWNPGAPTGFPEQTIELGVYTGSLTTNNLNHFADLDLDRVTFSIIQPNLPPGCTFSTNTCIALVAYDAVISLPFNANGYHILYDRCCRPGNIDNLQNSGSQSLTYKVFIPNLGGALATNSTPVFTDTLSSYLCVGDTTFFQNSAIDPDGDSLVYSFETPFDGLTTNGAPIANYSGVIPIQFNPYPNPPPLVNWAAGFNLNNMFGVSGFQSINSQNGVTTFTASQAGVYVAVVEIREFRNGQLISVTRRDLQILAINCPVNPVPTQDTTNLDPTAVNATTYIIEEGESVCIDLDYFDPNGDTIAVQASGSVLDASQVNPTGTFTSPGASDSALTAQFCWNTTCNQGRNQPYTFSVTVTDQGCPPKEFVETYEIIVEEFLGPTVILGDTLVCGDTLTPYSVTPIAGVTYNWQVTGGTIVSGNGTEQIEVNWGSGPTGNVSLSVVSVHGCPAGPIDLDVIISEVTADAGPDQTLCIGDSVTLGGSPTGPAGATISWTPTTNLNGPNDPNPVARPPVTTTYTVEVTNALGCSDTDQVIVTVTTLLPTGLDSLYYLCPGDTLDLALQNTVTRSWSPGSDLTDGTTANPRFFPLSNQQYVLTYTDPNGCTGFDTIDIVVNPNVPTNAGPDQAICEGDTIQIGGSPTAPANSTFSWSPVGSLDDPNLSNPLAHPSVTTTYIVLTANDTCTGRDTVVVTINPNPVISTSPDTTICTGDTADLLVTGTGTIQWSNGASLSSDIVSDPRAFPAVTTLYGVTVTDANNCSSEDSVQVSIQPIPLASAGGDSVNGCFLAPIVLGGTPTGPPGATYQWSPATDLDDPTLANPTVVTDTDRVYTLVVTDTLGCVNTDSALVLTFRITNTPDSLLCAGDTFLVTSIPINGVPGFQIEVDPSAEVIPPSLTGTPFTGIVPTQSDSYRVIITDTLGCADTSTFSVEVLEQAEAGFDYTTSTTCEGQGVDIVNTSNNATSYIWSLNDNRFSGAENPDLLLPFGQDYTLQLITLNSSGCNDTVEVFLPVADFEAEFDLDVPNAFTPNGDGINDFFELRSYSGLESCIEMQIFNRWGHLVYESSGDVHTWDGTTFAGEQVPAGVYFYVFDIRGNQVTGSINILR